MIVEDSMARKDIQPLGELTQELENVIQKMIDQHDLQNGEIDGILHTYLEIHYPLNKEPYVDGTQPVRYYGHIDGLIAFAKGLQNVKKKRK